MDILDEALGECLTNTRLHTVVTSEFLIFSSSCGILVTIREKANNYQIWRKFPQIQSKVKHFVLTHKRPLTINVEWKQPPEEEIPRGVIVKCNNSLYGSVDLPIRVEMEGEVTNEDYTVLSSAQICDLCFELYETRGSAVYFVGFIDEIGFHENFDESTLIADAWRTKHRFVFSIFSPFNEVL